MQASISYQMQIILYRMEETQRWVFITCAWEKWYQKFWLLFPLSPIIKIQHTEHGSCKILFVMCVLFFNVVVSFQWTVKSSQTRKFSIMSHHASCGHLCKRKSRESFLQLAKSEPGIVHEVVFAIQQSNLPELEKLVLELSTPGNQRFQKWLSYEDVSAIVSNQAGADAVLKWLEVNNVEVSASSQRNDYIRAKAPVSVWNRLLETDFYLFEDQTKAKGLKKGRLVHRANSYSLPEVLKPHVSVVFNTIQTPPVLHARASRKYTPKSSFRSAVNSTAIQANREGSPVTVSFLNDYYKITSNSGSPAMQQAVFETHEEYFSPSDLTNFQTRYGLPIQAAEHPFDHKSTHCTTVDCLEGNLDLQYIMGVAQHTRSVYWYVPETASSDPFVDWIVAVASETHPPLVNSISWGTIEQNLDKSVLDAFNTEAIKLAAMGVTIVVASGDNGATGDTAHCPLASGIGESPGFTGASWSGKGYFPIFPATSPYVTVVGATMGPQHGDHEVACESNKGGIITSGGGFSTYYPTPSWQQPAVSRYLSYVSSLQPAARPSPGYNPRGRGYPDVSFIGVNYQTVVQGQLVSLFGTSASAPVFAAMISLINAARAEKNLTSVGFLNPTLYAHGASNTFGAGNTSFIPYNDVTVGSNKCQATTSAGVTGCCDSGFDATAGWDPVTGWGSMYFPRLAQVFRVDVNYTGSYHHHKEQKLGENGMIILVSIVGVVALVGLVAFINWMFPRNSAPTNNQYTITAAHAEVVANGRSMGGVTRGARSVEVAEVEVSEVVLAEDGEGSPVSVAAVAAVVTPVSVV